MYFIRGNIIELAQKNKEEMAAGNLQTIHGVAEYIDGPLKIRADISPYGQIRAAALIKQSDGSWFTKGPVALIVRNDLYKSIIEACGEKWVYRPESYYYKLTEHDSDFETLKRDLYGFLKRTWDDAFQILFVGICVYGETINLVMEDPTEETLYVSRMALLDYYLEAHPGDDVQKFGKWFRTRFIDDLDDFPDFAYRRRDIMWARGNIELVEDRNLLLPTYKHNIIA